MTLRNFRALLALGIVGISFLGAPSGAQSASGSISAPPLGHLAPGDDVIVVVFREKELTARVYVDDREQVALPRLGVISVGGLTTDMLRDTIRARYGTFLRDPSVDVRALRRITVNGAVLKPDVYFTDPSMTLRDVIARAGGVTNEGNPHKVSVVRGPLATEYPHWSETAEGLTQLRSGDEVVVGRRSWASLNVGAVVGIAGLLTSLMIAFKR
jgi:polysaccharide export outer membrane protein